MSAFEKLWKMFMANSPHVGEIIEFNFSAFSVLMQDTKAELAAANERIEGLVKAVKCRDNPDTAHDYINELEAENQRLREALEAIEWEWAYGNGWRCPWCHALKESGWHKRDCQRQAALQKESE